ncbi:MAG TPA: 5'-nucleotidase, lipoprotein e(P4) family [Thermoanaerobaculia bacterium]|nr:5'-nucleotidase, lipoprotein e(P4) family [Thermoanaerobaculia bacterium]
MRRTVQIAVLLLAVGCRTPGMVAPPPSAAPEPVAPAATPSATARSTADHRLLNAVLWIQTAAEYRALALQAFNSARTALDRALADPTISAAPEQLSPDTSLPPAVIVDVDETMLDNSPFEARLILSGGSFNAQNWTAWVDERNAPAIPGALEFARHAASRGVTIFYVSNRDAEHEAATRDNLRSAGFPLSAEIDTVLLRGERPEWATSEKSDRRRSVARGFRVLLMIGDDLGDFLPGVRVSRDERLDKIRPYESWWGTRWFVVPNPMYGSWEGALTAGASPEERDQRLLESLRTGR